MPNKQNLCVKYEKGMLQLQHIAPFICIESKRIKMFSNLYDERGFS